MLAIYSGPTVRVNISKTIPSTIRRPLHRECHNPELVVNGKGRFLFGVSRVYDGHPGSSILRHLSPSPEFVTTPSIFFDFGTRIISPTTFFSMLVDMILKV